MPAFIKSMLSDVIKSFTLLYVFRARVLEKLLIEKQDILSLKLLLFFNILHIFPGDFAQTSRTAYLNECEITTALGYGCTL